MVVPIARLVIDPEQQKHIRFDAFFENTMFPRIQPSVTVLLPGAIMDGFNAISVSLYVSKYTSI